MNKADNAWILAKNSLLNEQLLISSDPEQAEKNAMYIYQMVWFYGQPYCGSEAEIALQQAFKEKHIAEINLQDAEITLDDALNLNFEETHDDSQMYEISCEIHEKIQQELERETAL